jgi:osmotically-inducible protein OsmY
MCPLATRRTLGSARLPGGDPVKTDSEIRDDVIEELCWDPQLTDPDAIGVAVQDGAVTLTGTVPSYAEKLAAAGRPSGCMGSRPWPTI